MVNKKQIKLCIKYINNAKKIADKLDDPSCSDALGDAEDYIYQELEEVE